MSFDDEPIVDDNAKRSEESVNLVKSLFTMKNGFITKEERPDYGVDLDVELITAGASSYKFPIQIKSVIRIKKIKLNGEEVISHPFETSRLKYLAKRPPAYGIFALYDDTNQVCYFDYVDDIVRRLDTHPDREGWRGQTTVNILFPLKVLNVAVLPSLHERFIKRFRNNQLMLQEHGADYNIPDLEQRTNQALPKLNLKDPDQVADFLELYGSRLYNESEIAMLNQLLGFVSRERLNSTPKLIFLAAITFTQTGHILDAEYYIRKARKLPEVMQGEGTTMIELATARLEFMKGNTDYDLFLSKFRLVVGETKDPINQLTIKVNILFFELTRGLETDVFPANYTEQLAELEQEIAAADIPLETKHLIQCHHSDCQFHFASRGELNLFKEVKISEAQGKPMPMEERMRRMNAYIALIEASDHTVYNAYLFGRDSDHLSLKAAAAHQMGQHFFAQRMNLLMICELQKMAQNKAKFVSSFETHQNYSLIAYNEFLKLNLFHTAHEALSMAYEINMLCIHLTGTQVGKKTPLELMTILKETEAKYELQPFKSRVTKLLGPS